MIPRQEHIVSEKSDRKLFGLPVGKFTIDTSKVPEGDIKNRLEAAKGLGSNVLDIVIDWAKQTGQTTVGAVSAAQEQVFERTRESFNDLSRPLGRLAVGAQDVARDLKNIIFKSDQDEPALGDRPTKQTETEG